MRNHRIVLLPGDGIGPEVIGAAVGVLHVAARRFGFSLSFDERLVGGAAIDAAGVPLPAETLNACRAADAVLMGAIGGPKWDHIDIAVRPERGLLALRSGMKVFANLRPVKVYPALAGASPLKNSEGVDMIIVRELTGDAYFGEKHETDDQGVAWDAMRYDRGEIRRVAKTAFRLAGGRRGRVTSVDKANVLASSRLWRATMEAMAAEHPDIAVDHMYADNASMQLILNPRRFDVLLTGNLFGDILSDEASVLAGSIGMMPSASLGDGGPGLYEPVHGSAPDIAGRDIANPLAAILSAAMLLRWSLNETAAADAVEAAVEAVLESGARTADLAAAGEAAIGCAEMGRRVAERVVPDTGA